MKDLSGRVVLVTGASSGIGKATARAFAFQGCRLALAARRPDKLALLSRELGALGAESLAIPCDVRRREDAKAAVEAAVLRWSRLDVLVNNAGIMEVKPFERQDLAVVEDIIQTNLLGAAYVLHAALPHMRRRGEGHIVNVASIAGLIGLPMMSAYCASKWALVGLTESLRRELYGSGVTLTAFCPGSVDTPMTEAITRDPRMPRGLRIKTAGEVADKIVWATRRRARQVVFGEAPGGLITASKFFTALTDWATYSLMRRLHPLGRRYLGA